MMFNKMVFCTVLVSAAILLNGCSCIRTPIESEVIATLDYSDPNRRNSTLEDEHADEFFESLIQYAGNAIKLDLTIIPVQDQQSVAYRMRYLAPALNAAEEAEIGQQIECGSGVFGVQNNLHRMIRLTFQHPLHYHSPIDIYIGDRIKFPQSSVICSSEQYTSQARTPVHIKGYFFVEVAEVPTANQFVLYPYRP
ncbi:hypothetical protein KFE80_08850 [bacterium SCSIO 12696]|nr:hypothetical protein KFE80_08850 [bacterium SCSIO 12696]